MTGFESDKFVDEMSRLLGIMQKLRDPDGGCPWDLEQTFSSIAPHTIEEAYEVADAIEAQDWQHLKEELGDLLLQVVFHSQMAKDQNLFAFDDVARGISEKMLSRHPHVFGDDVIESSGEQTVAWERLKELERKEKAKSEGLTRLSALDGVATGLPSLTRALKLQKRAVRVGFEWPDIHGVLDKVREELAEVEEEINAPCPNHDAIKDEIGDLLFTVVNVARWFDVDPDSALRGCNQKFENRFRKMEEYLEERDLNISEVNLDQMQEGWVAAKKLEK